MVFIAQIPYVPGNCHIVYCISPSSSKQTRPDLVFWILFIGIQIALRLWTECNLLNASVPTSVVITSFFGNVFGLADLTSLLSGDFVLGH